MKGYIAGKKTNKPQYDNMIYLGSELPKKGSDDQWGQLTVNLAEKIAAVWNLT